MANPKFAATLLGSLLATALPAQAQEWPVTSVNSSSALWPASNLRDGNLNSQWSSQGYADPAHTEWISYTLDTFRPVNYIKLYPRVQTGSVLGFPKSFSVYWSNGSQWNLARTYTNFSTPTRADHIIIPLPTTVSTNNLHVVATSLSADNFNNYFFQLGEVGAGYNAAFSKLSYLGNSGSGDKIEVRNVGSGPFSPSKMAVWNYDDRNPIITPSSAPRNPACQGSNVSHPSYDAATGTMRNIYAATVAKRANGGWTIIYGGYDGTCTADEHDRIYRVTTPDFSTFTYTTSGGNRAPVLSNGSFTNANNPSITALDASGSQLRMAYTAYVQGSPKNKTAQAFSSDYGATWSPSPPSAAASLITMSGFPGWGDLNTGEDVNGTNALIYDAGTYHLYWKGDGLPIYHATSTDGKTFQHQGTMLNQGGCYGINDARKINNQYLWLFHCNANLVWYKTSPSLNSWDSALPATLFDTTGSPPNLGADAKVVSMGAVTDGTRLFGALYGAGPSSANLWRNSIFARWLQKKVTVSNGFVALNQPLSRGPDVSLLKTAGPQTVETATIRIYDSDGATLLYTSPPVTVRAGDIWQYVP